MELSPSITTEPMRKEDRARVIDFRAVLSYLVDRHTSEAFPAMSDHYEPPVEEPVEVQMTLF